MDVICTVLDKTTRSPIPEEGIKGRVVKGGSNTHSHRPIIRGITFEGGQTYRGHFERAVARRTIANREYRQLLETWEDEMAAWERGGKRGPQPRKPKLPRVMATGKASRIVIEQIPITPELCHELAEESKSLHEGGTPLVEFHMAGAPVAAAKVPKPVKAARASSDDDTPSPPAMKLNANTATVEQLVELPGIGAKLAEQIVAWRTEHGPFASISDVAAVNLKLKPEVLAEILTV